jgi:hypothetical protein
MSTFNIQNQNKKTMNYLRSFISPKPVSQSASQPVSQSDPNAPTGSLNGHQVHVLTENEQTAEKAFPSSNDGPNQKSGFTGQAGAIFRSENNTKRELYIAILNNPKISSENKEKALGALRAANIKGAEDTMDFKIKNRQFFLY